MHPAKAVHLLRATARALVQSSLMSELKLTQSQVSTLQRIAIKEDQVGGCWLPPSQVYSLIEKGLVYKVPASGKKGTINVCMEKRGRDLLKELTIPE